MAGFFHECLWSSRLAFVGPAAKESCITVTLLGRPVSMFSLLAKQSPKRHSPGDQFLEANDLHAAVIRLLMGLQMA